MSMTLWTATTDTPEWPRLDRDLAADVAIIGAGITGLTCAYLLHQAGKSVVVLDRRDVASGMSSRTTAMLTQVIDAPLSKLVRDFSPEVAGAAWDAGKVAIDFIAQVVHKEAIACDLLRIPAYHYASTPEAAAFIREEVRVARDLGFPAEYVHEQPYPLASFGALYMPDQGQFHPRRYLLGMAQRLQDRGVSIFPRTDVTKVHSGAQCRLVTRGGTVTAGCLVYAAHHPLNNNLLVSKVAAYQTYVIALKVAPGTFPQALAWDTEDPYHYWRQAPMDEYDLVLVGGEDHRTGQEPDPRRRFDNLERYAREALGDRPYEVVHRWSGQVLNPADGLPFIGRNGHAPNEYVATGFAGNGMTFGTYSGMRLTDLVLGREVPAATIFNPDRFGLKAGAVTFLSENLAYPTHLVERLKPEPPFDPEALAPGEGQVVEQDGRRIAVARDAEGALHACSAVCTHLGCVVHWNGVEATWDCPCHGSRFAIDGEVLDGPTQQALDPALLKVHEEQR